MTHHKDKPHNRLYRSRDDRMLGGVCAGLADYFEMDPTWMRLIFILLILLGGSAVLVYLIMWIIVPLEPEENDQESNHQSSE